MLPVDAHTTALAPSSTALEMAMVMPRSLKLPVGLAPSTFSHTSAPTRSERRGAGTQRRAALEQGDHRGALGDREEVAVLLDDAAPAGRHGAPPLSRVVGSPRR